MLNLSVEVILFPCDFVGIMEKGEEYNGMKKKDKFCLREQCVSWKSSLWAAAWWSQMVSSSSNSSSSFPNPISKEIQKYSHGGSKKAEKLSEEGGTVDTDLQYLLSNKY